MCIKRASQAIKSRRLRMTRVILVYVTALIQKRGQGLVHPFQPD